MVSIDSTGADRIDSITAEEYQGIPGFVVKQGDGVFFIPASNVSEAVLSPDEAA
jgi:hypothetical protein